MNPMDSDLSAQWNCPTFVQLEPGRSFMFPLSMLVLLRNHVALADLDFRTGPCGIPLLLLRLGLLFGLYGWFSRYVIAAMLVDENKRFPISSYCSSTSNCTLQHCYLCPKRLVANHRRPINYFFVCMLISPLCLIFTSKFFCFLYLMPSSRGLINMQTKE